MRNEDGICAAANPAKTFICRLNPSAKALRIISCVVGGNEETDLADSKRISTCGWDRKSDSLDLKRPLRSVVAMAMPIAPPMIRNCVIEPIATAVDRPSA